MTDIDKKVQKAGAARKPAGTKKPAASAKRGRDAYDDFLDGVEPAVKKPSAPRKRVEEAPAKKTASASGSSSSAGKKKEASAAKSAPGTGAKKSGTAAKKKVERQGDLLTAVEQLEQGAKLRRDVQTAKDRPKKGDAAAVRKPAKQSAKGSGRDPFDDFLDAAEKPRTAKKSGKKKTGKKASSKAMGATLALLVAIASVAALVGWQYTQYQTFLVMKAAVDRSTFYEGTTVEGVDLSAMTLEQAIEHWATGIEPGYSQRKVTLSNGASFTAEELGYSSDYVTVLSNAWNAGRKGSLAERYEALSFRRSQPASYNVSRIPYRTELIEQCVEAIAAQIDRPAENSRIESFDKESYEFRFTDAVVGSRLDQDQLKQDMISALDAGGGTAELVVLSIQPEVKKEDIASQYGMISSAVTNASSSSKNRLANIKLASELINGTCLEPGETFSFNGVVGERTKDRGFKVATAYSGGTVVEDVGGGICQVSTTLFNAAVKADLEIVERHNHSLTVGYVDKGKDAAVNWGSQDLRFTNTSDDNVYICCYVDSDKRVRFGVFGKLLENGETITVEAKTTGRIDYETELVPNMALPSGYTAVSQTGKQGYRAEAYKVRWDAAGNEISRELLCKSTYKSTKEIIEYGP